jgi:hypothetical protein
MNNETSNYFHEHGYVIVRNFIDPQMALFLYEYAKMKVYAMSLKEIYDPHLFDKEWDGKFGENQVGAAYYCYGDPIMDTLMYLTTNKVEEYIGLNLVPTYTYWRLYEKNDTLLRHVDRPSCEISGTLCLGYDVSNVKNQSYTWPMWVQSLKTKEEVPGYANPGDIILYKGCIVEHWRESFLGLNHAQMFMHFNDVNGSYKRESGIPRTEQSGLSVRQFDGRVALGVPAKFKALPGTI